MKLKGYKTYIAGFLMVVAAGCYQLGYIDGQLFAVIGAALTGGGFIALRAGVKKAE